MQLRADVRRSSPPRLPPSVGRLARWCSLNRNAWPLPANRSDPPIFLRAGFALAPWLQSPREQAFANGYNSGANGRNFHEMPPVPTGGSSYLSAIGVPVVEPMVHYICALLRVSPSEMLEAAGPLPREAPLLLSAARKPRRANGRVLEEQRPVIGGDSGCWVW